MSHREYYSVKWSHLWTRPTSVERFLRGWVARDPLVAGLRPAHVSLAEAAVPLRNTIKIADFNGYGPFKGARKITWFFRGHFR